MPPDRCRHGHGRGTRRGHGRVPTHLRRRGDRARIPARPTTQPPAQRHHRNCRGHGDQHAHPQSGRGPRRDHAHDEQATAEAHDRRDAGRAPRSRLPQRRHRGRRRHPRGLRDRPRDHTHPGPGARGGHRPGPPGHRGHRTPVPGGARACDLEAQGAERGGTGDGHRGLQEPLGSPHRPPPPGDGQARPQPPGRPGRAVPPDAAGGDVRHKQRRPGRWRAPHTRDPRDVPSLHRPPPRRGGAPHTPPAGQGRGATPPGGRPPHGSGGHRRGGGHHPRLGGRGDGARRPHGSFRPQPAPDRPHPRHAPEAAHRTGDPSPARRAGRPGGLHPRLHHAPRLREAAKDAGAGRVGRSRGVVRASPPDRDSPSGRPAGVRLRDND